MTDRTNHCPDCQAAAVGLHHIFRASCKDCTARGIGRGPNFRASATAGRLTSRYQEELRACGVSHEQVKAARAADFEAKGATCG